MQSVERRSSVSRITRAEHALHARCPCSAFAITIHNARGRRWQTFTPSPPHRCAPLFSPSAPVSPAATHELKPPPCRIRFCSLGRLVMQGHLWLAFDAIRLLHTAPPSSHSNLVAGLCCASIAFGFACLWRLRDRCRREWCSSSRSLC